MAWGYCPASAIECIKRKWRSALGQVVSNQRIGMTMAELMFCLEQGDQLHVLEVASSS